MNNMFGLDLKIKEIANRIRELREIENLSTLEMSKKTGVSEAEYISCEEGLSDLNFAFIYRCALAFNVDVTDIIEGHSPNLKSYTLTRAGKGQKIEQAHGMTYYNLAAKFKNRIAEPLYVLSEYNEDAQNKEIELTTHKGQECDLVVSGHLKVKIGDHEEVLGPGDSIYYDSSTPHGMIAVNGEDCIFYAIVLNPLGDDIPELQPKTAPILSQHKKDDKQKRVYSKFVDLVEDEKGTPISINFKNEDKFNFAFDVVDAISQKQPDKLALLHIARDKTERRFSFKEIQKHSCRAANYFKSLGIKKGDRVMLVLGRDYQFWFAILGLHRIGAIAIPAMNQLLSHDFEYRFNAAGVSAIICTAKGDAANNADIAAANCPTLKHKILVDGEKEGWHNFDEEYSLFSAHFVRTEDTPCGDCRIDMSGGASACK